MIPTLTHHLPLRPRLAPATPRITPLVRRVHAKAKPEAAKPEIAKAVVAPKRPGRHVVRQVQHRAHHTYAPGTAVSPYATYSVTSGVQYR